MTAVMRLVGVATLGAGLVGVTAMVASAEEAPPAKTAEVTNLPLDGVPVVQRTEVRGEAPTYAVTLTAGQRVQVLCQATSKLTSFAVHGPDGKVVKADPSGGNGICSLDKFKATMLFTAGDAGTYQIIVKTLIEAVKAVAIGGVTVLPDATTTLATDGTPVTIATTGAYQRAQATISLTGPAQKLNVECDRETGGRATVVLFRSGSATATGFCEGLGDVAVSTSGTPGEYMVLVIPGDQVTNTFTLQARLT